jgi:hypothetical protein
MVSTEERMRILMMIQEGKITAAEGAQLIEALDELSEPVPPSPPAPGEFVLGKKPRYLRILVTDSDTGKTRVNVSLPVSLIESGMQMGAKLVPEVQGLSWEDLSAWMTSGESGQIVDVFDEEDGEHIEVFLE